MTGESKEDIRKHTERRVTVSSLRGESRDNTKDNRNKTIIVDSYSIGETRNRERILK